MSIGANTMYHLDKDWLPSQEVMNRYTEVNHDREIKYFKHFYIKNQYIRSDWDQEYCKWCDKQLSRKRNNTKVRRETKQSHEDNSFYYRIIAELSDK